MPSTEQLIRHVVWGTDHSPYVSLTRSFGVALSYALLKRTPDPRHKRHGYIYEIELPLPIPSIVVLDPIVEIARSLPTPNEPPYQHDGDPDFLLGVMAPETHAGALARPYRQPPPGRGTPRPPRLTPDVEALVRSLRDSEILVYGQIPRECVKNRFEVTEDGNSDS